MRIHFNDRETEKEGNIRISEFIEWIIKILLNHIYSI